MRNPASLPVLLACLVALSFHAWGQLGGPSGVRVPFRGHLERDGQPVEGTLRVRFHVYNAAADPEPCSSGAWSEVTVRAGTLAAEAGPFPESCVRNRDVYLAVEIDDGAGPVALSGRQRVFSAAIASTSGTGDFDVGGDLEVGADMTVSGDLSVAGGATASSLEADAATVNGLVSSVPAQVRALRLDDAGRQTLRVAADEGFLSGSNVAGNFHIDANSPPRGSNAVNTQQRLYLNWYSGNGVAFGNGAQGVVGSINADAELWMNGDLNAPSNGHGECYWTAWGCGVIYCGDGFYVAGLENQDGEGCGGAGNIDDFPMFRLLCCRL